MGGRRVHGGSNVVRMLQKNGISPEAIDALLASGSPTGFPGSGCMVNFEYVRGSTPESSFYREFDREETGNDDLDESFQQPGKKRRLAANQVQFLERSFELDNKLENEKKAQLARHLGLQPRQVAIWFQNRQARWKTKQQEKDCEALKFGYNGLMADYENLLKEKEKLKGEVLALKDKLQLKEERSSSQTLEHTDTMLHHRLQDRDVDLTYEIKKTDMPMLVCKQEDISSANSAVFDSKNTLYTSKKGQSPPLEPTDSSNAFEQDHSDLSHAEKEDEQDSNHFPKLEDDSCNYVIPVEDQTFWFWP